MLLVYTKEGENASKITSTYDKIMQTVLVIMTTVIEP